MKKLFFLLASNIVLSGCGGGGGGSSGVDSGPTSFGSLPAQELQTRITNDDGSGVATVYRLGNAYTIYRSELADIDINATANIDPNSLTVLEEGVDYGFYEGNYVDDGNQKYLFVYAKRIGPDENVVAGLARNANVAGGEIVQAYGSVVSGQVPVGDLTYTGYNLLTSVDQTQIDSGTFTMRVNFQENTGSLRGNGDVSFVEANNIQINSSTGTFSSNDVRLGYIDGDSASGFILGNFHGNGATGVTGLYGTAGELDAVGVIAGSR